MAFVAETEVPAAEQRTVTVVDDFLQTRTTLSMSAYVPIDHANLDPGASNSYMKGNEGSDFVVVYYALDRNRRVSEGETVEIIGDGKVIELLGGGQNKVSARWGGKNWTPELVEPIREAERAYGHVSYRVIASAANRAGNYVDRVKLANLEKTRSRKVS